MELNTKAKVYLSSLSISAIILYIVFLKKFNIPDYRMLLFWIILAIIVESLLIFLPKNSVGVSVGYAINIATVIVGGPLLATTASSLGLLFRFPKINGRGYVHVLNTQLYKTVFNISQSIIVNGIISIVYIRTGGVVGEFSFIPTVIILVLGTLINTAIISGFLNTVTGQAFYRVWFNNVKGMFASAVAVGTMGIIIALAFIGYGYGAVLLFFGPLLLARYSFKLYIDMRSLYLSTIDALNKAVEAKDQYTSGHAGRVEELSVQLAESYGLSYDSVENIKTAALLHDLGKIAINDSILNKAGRLTQEEYEQIMLHPTKGSDIISKVDFLKDVSMIIKHHHERYDGKGYPDGMRGEDIPIEACVLTIVDSYDAMTTDRPYRSAMTNEEALEEIRKNMGTQFHPLLAEKFIDMMKS